LKELDLKRGGGQVLRTATAIAAAIGKEVKIKNIRRARPTPGLKEQHLKGVRGIAEITNGELKKDKKGSTEIEFKPGKTIKPEIEINIETAGSVGLILQQFQILALEKQIEITVNGGGTHVKWAPPVEYMSEIFLPLMKKYNYEGEIEVEKEGFYPKGGARVKARLNGEKLNKIRIKERGKLKKITGISKASEQLKQSKVVERQKKAAKKELKRKERKNIKPEIEEKYVRSLSPGSGILLRAETDKTIIGADQVGEKGKPSEEIGIEAAEELTEELDSEASVDIHMADQIVPYMGYVEKETFFKTRKITKHIETNIEITKELLNADFIVEEDMIRCLGRNSA